MGRVTANKLFFKDGLGGQKHFFSEQIYIGKA